MREKAYLTGLLQRFFAQFPDEYGIVMSLGYPNAPDRAIRKGNLTVHYWVPNRFEYLKACDLVVARAGHGTITHSICYGKPMVLIPTPSHTEQLNNAKRAAELGVAEVIEQENLTLKRLLSAVQEALENREMKLRVRRVQAEALRLNGLEQATRMIMDLAQKQD